MDALRLAILHDAACKAERDADDALLAVDLPPQTDMDSDDAADDPEIPKIPSEARGLPATAPSAVKAAEMEKDKGADDDDNEDDEENRRCELAVKGEFVHLLERRIGFMAEEKQSVKRTLWGSPRLDAKQRKRAAQFLLDFSQVKEGEEDKALILVMRAGEFVAAADDDRKADEKRTAKGKIKKKANRGLTPKEQLEHYLGNRDILRLCRDQTDGRIKAMREMQKQGLQAEIELHIRKRQAELTLTEWVDDKDQTFWYIANGYPGEDVEKARARVGQLPNPETYLITLPTASLFARIADGMRKHLVKSHQVDCNTHGQRPIHRGDLNLRLNGQTQWKNVAPADDEGDCPSLHATLKFPTTAGMLVQELAYDAETHQLRRAIHTPGVKPEFLPLDEDDFKPLDEREPEELEEPIDAVLGQPMESQTPVSAPAPSIAPSPETGSVHQAHPSEGVTRPSLYTFLESQGLFSTAENIKPVVHVDEECAHTNHEAKETEDTTDAATEEPQDEEDDDDDPTLGRFLTTINASLLSWVEMTACAMDAALCVLLESYLCILQEQIVDGPLAERDSDEAAYQSALTAARRHFPFVIPGPQVKDKDGKMIDGPPIHLRDGDYDPRRFAYQTVLEMAVTNIDLEGGVDIFARYTPLFTFIGEHNQLEEARKARLAEVDRRIKAGEREVPLDPNDKQPPPTLFLMIQRDGRYLDIAKESKPSKRRNRLKKLQEDTIEFEKQVRLLYKARKEERERQAAAAAPAETTGEPNLAASPVPSTESAIPVDHEPAEAVSILPVAAEADDSPVLSSQQRAVLAAVEEAAAAMKPLDPPAALDMAVHRAVALGLDRDAIVQAAVQGAVGPLALLQIAESNPDGEHAAAAVADASRPWPQPLAPPSPVVQHLSASAIRAASAGTLPTSGDIDPPEVHSPAPPPVPEEATVGATIQLAESPSLPASFPPQAMHLQEPPFEVLPRAEVVAAKDSHHPAATAPRSTSEQ